MQRGGARRDGDGMLRADELREILFERIEVRTSRRDPIGLEGFQDVFDFGGTDIRWRQVNSAGLHKSKLKLRARDTVASGDG